MIKEYPVHIKLFTLAAITLALWVVNFSFGAREVAILNANYDTVYISQFGLNIGVDAPIRVPKGRLPVGPKYGQMSFNVQSPPTGYSFQNTFSFPLVQEAHAQTSGSGQSVTVSTGGGGGSFTTSSDSNSSSNYTSQLSSILGIINNPQNAILEPFGGVAYGFPCCNGWFYYMQQCGKCDDAGVGDSELHMAWWFSLRKWYMPTGGNPVLGLFIDTSTDCYLLLPPYCYCDCEIEADVTDYIVGTANNSSKSSQTTQDP